MICIEDHQVICLCAEIYENSNYEIIAQGNAPFGGFKKLRSISATGLSSAMVEAIELAQEQAGGKIRELHVGVPGIFCEILLTNPNAYAEMEDDTFAVEREIYLDDQFELIHRVPLPKEQKQTTQGQISSIQALREYIEETSAALSNIGMRPASFVSQNYVQGMYIIPRVERQDIAIMFNVEYYNTDVCVFYGDSQVYTVTLKLGGWHVTSDLMQVLELKQHHAEALRAQYVFGIEISDDQLDYIRLDNGKLQGFDHALVDSVISARVDELCELIHSSLSYSEYYPEKDGKGYLIGPGLSDMRGVRDYIGAALQLRLQGLPVDMVDGTTGFSISALAALDYVAKKERTSRGLIDRMKKRLFGK